MAKDLSNSRCQTCVTSAWSFSPFIKGRPPAFGQPQNQQTRASSNLLKTSILPARCPTGCVADSWALRAPASEYLIGSDNTKPSQTQSRRSQLELCQRTIIVGMYLSKFNFKHANTKAALLDSVTETLTPILMHHPPHCDDNPFATSSWDRETKIWWERVSSQKLMWRRLLQARARQIWSSESA